MNNFLSCTNSIIDLNVVSRHLVHGSRNKTKCLAIMAVIRDQFLPQRRVSSVFPLMPPDN